MRSLVFACIVLLTVGASAQQGVPGEKQQQAERKNQQQAESRPTDAQRNNPPRADVAGPSEAGKTRQKPATAKTAPSDPWLDKFGPSELISLLALLFNGAFFYYTIQMWREMVRANEHSEKTYQESAEETTESLSLTRQGQIATQRAVKAAEDQLVAIVRFARAQVTVSGILKPNEILPQGHPPSTVTIQLTNAGHTPAVNLEWVGNSAIGPKGDSFTWDLDDDTPMPVTSGTSIGGGHSINVAIEVLALSELELDALIHRSTELRLRGRARYRDIFSDALRQTEFEAAFRPLPHGRWLILRQTEE